MHDEGNLRAVPGGPSRSRKRRRKRGVLLLQPGPGSRLRRLRQSARAAESEWRAGEAHAAVDRPLAAAPGPAAGGGVVAKDERKGGSSSRQNHLTRPMLHLPAATHILPPFPAPPSLPDPPPRSP